MANSLSSRVTGVLNGTLEAVKTVIPLPMRVGTPSLVTSSIIQPEMGVLIGIAGEVRGRLFAEAPQSVFAAVAQAMFGMEVAGEMLESFVGELGNMIAGNMCTLVAQEGTKIDITPPTVLVGQTKLSGYETALAIPVLLEGYGELKILLMVGETVSHHD